MEDNRKTQDEDRLPLTGSPINTPDFMREKIKQRPINKKNLLRRTLTTVMMAVVFGVVACLTFVFMSPVINKKLYPEESPAPIALTEETVTDEMQPEDMYADDNAIAAEAASVAIDMASTELSRMQKEISSYHFDSSDYIEMYASLKAIASNTSKGIVTVTSQTSDTNWINDPYESEGNASGIIVAENGSEYMILTQTSAISQAQSLSVTFFDGNSSSAHLKMSDRVSGLSVLGVKVRDVPDKTRDNIAAVSLGSSNASAVTGTPVIAIGSPTGTQGSISYGFITSGSASLDLADSNYKMLTTDMYGSTTATGAIINLSGSVVGFIDMKYNAQTLPNMLCAVGITELRPLIEDLSNGVGRNYVGIYGQTVPETVRVSEDVPAGVYVTRTDMDSPAMQAGIQSGDIITKINDYDIVGYDTYISKLRTLKSGDEATVTLMRQSADGYVELNIQMEIANSASNDTE